MEKMNERKKEIIKKIREREKKYSRAGCDTTKAPLEEDFGER
jgi:hypothetical protein